MKYLIVYERTGSGYSAYLPDLPGCVATGRTRKEVEKRIREAVEMHIEGLREDGQEPARPASFAEYHEITG